MSATGYLKRALVAWCAVALLASPSFTAMQASDRASHHPLPLSSGGAIAPAPAGTVIGHPIQMHVGGRVVQTTGGYLRQWPGTYFEGAFAGSTAFLRVGPGDVVLNVRVDGEAALRLVKPQPGLYRITALSGGRHIVRVDVASESQSSPTVFGGLYAASGIPPRPAIPRSRQVEFIGDSHTVGYGNLSTTRDCTPAQVWNTTDTARGPGALVARRYNADYRVNAISGRGIVRNYDGGPGDTLPVAYPFALFDHGRRAADTDWHPRLIVIGLGTNDFSTALHAGEQWNTRAALHAAYQARYVAFVQFLRVRHPDAEIVLWATDMANGEILAAIAGVVARLKSGGMSGLGLVAVPGLAFSGCHAHPSVADDERIATLLSRYVDARPEIWAATRRKRPS